MDFCHNCGEAGGFTVSLLDAKFICSNCGAEKLASVLKGDERKFIKGIVVLGTVYAKAEDIFSVDTVKAEMTNINFKGGVITKLPTKYIYENTRLV